MKPLILASQSPRRRELIKSLNVPYEVLPADVDETCALTRPSALVKHLALKKAKAVAEQNPGRVVIGADTIVVCKGKILGKPEHHADAIRILELQNGSWQSVYTGVAIVTDDKVLCDYEVSRCKARRLSEEQLRKLAGKHMDKAGAYAVQDHDDPFIEKITGPVDNVVGLPCELLKELLSKAGALQP